MAGLDKRRINNACKIGVDACLCAPNQRHQWLTKHYPKFLQFIGSVAAAKCRLEMK